MDNLLKHNEDVHQQSSRYGTLNLNLVCLRFVRETERDRSFTVTSIKFWNSLPNCLKKADSLNNRLKMEFSDISLHAIRTSSF